MSGGSTAYTFHCEADGLDLDDVEEYMVHGRITKLPRYCSVTETLEDVTVLEKDNRQYNQVVEYLEDVDEEYTEREDQGTTLEGYCEIIETLEDLTVQEEDKGRILFCPYCGLKYRGDEYNCRRCKRRNVDPHGNHIAGRSSANDPAPKQSINIEMRLCDTTVTIRGKNADAKITL